MKTIDIRDWPKVDGSVPHPILEELLLNVQDPAFAAYLDEDDLAALPNKDWDNVDQRLRTLAAKRGLKLTLAKRWLYHGEFIGVKQRKRLPVSVQQELPSYLFVRRQNKRSK